MTPVPGTVLALYESESHVGQHLTVSWDGTNIICDCLMYKDKGTCKHIMDYDLSGGQAGQVQDDCLSSNPQPKGVATALQADGIDAIDHEKIVTREFDDVDVTEAVKKATQAIRDKE